MKKILVEIITPNKIGYKGEVNSITVPGTKGNFQILYNHAPIISSLEIGEIIIEADDNEKEYFATSGGTIEVVDNNVIVLAETFERTKDIDVKRAEEAKRRAEERLKKKREEKIDDFRAELALKRAMNRISSVKKHY
jgi:F-type H+-transporting ATPase subunit epsilon